MAQGRGRVSTDDLIYKTCLRDEEQLETFLATYGMERDGHMVSMYVVHRRDDLVRSVTYDFSLHESSSVCDEIFSVSD